MKLLLLLKAQDLNLWRKQIRRSVIDLAQAANAALVMLASGPVTPEKEKIIQALNRELGEWRGRGK